MAGQYAPGIRPGLATSDTNWIRQAVFSSIKKGVSNRDPSSKGSTFSSSELKYTDTTLGGSFAINPRPQFTRWCDPKNPGIGTESRGQGEFYSEAFDDNVERVHLQFGVPEYNSLTGFFSSFYDNSIGRMANTGDASDFIFAAGKAIGYILTLPFQAIVGFANLVNQTVAYVAGYPAHKYYYMKPTMSLYWSTVSHIVNMIGVNTGILFGPPNDNITDGDAEAMVKYKEANGLSYTEDAADLLPVLNGYLPEYMRGEGGIDIFAISTRAQRLAHAHAVTLKGIMDGAEGADYETFEKDILAYLDKKLAPPPVHYPIKSKTGKPNLVDHLNNYYAQHDIGKGVGAKDLVPEVTNDGTDFKGAGSPDAAAAPTKPSSGRGAAAARAKARAKAARDGSQDAVSSNAAASQNLESVRKWMGDKDYLKYEMQDGSAFVSFNVDYVSTVTESFSNSTKSSEIAGMMNGASSKGRSAFFNMAGGNIGDNPLLNGMEAVYSSVKSFVAGGLDSVGLGGLAALGGAAYVDMPDFWDNSTANLTKVNYSITLATPYGNKLAVMNAIMVPLACLLAGALPRATGRGSYTSPFLCRLHHTSKNIVKLGIIDSLSITRGGGGVGWTVDGLPTQVQINFSVLNLEKVASLSMTQLAGPTDFSMFDDDTAATDYLATLGGIHLKDQYYFSDRFKLAWNKKLADLDSWLSPSHMASSFRGTSLGGAMSIMYRVTPR